MTQLKRITINNVEYEIYGEGRHGLVDYYNIKCKAEALGHRLHLKRLKDKTVLHLVSVEGGLVK